MPTPPPPLLPSAALTSPVSLFSYGQVLKCIKRLDGQTYAVKKITRHQGVVGALRECVAMSALVDAQHTVRACFRVSMCTDVLFSRPGGLLVCTSPASRCC
jgi:hypothetical protein